MSSSICYRHGDRVAGVTCQRCDRAICPDCMRQASVGFHCPECAAPPRGSVAYRPASAEPVVTKALIGANIVVAVLGAVQGGLGAGQPDHWTYRYGLNGWAVDLGDWYRIITSGFLHDGILHLGFNMWALWMIGPYLEQLLGRGRFGALVAASLLGGSFGVLMLSPLSLTVGASGMVFGLFGGVAVVQRAMGLDVWRSGIGTLLGVNLLLTFLLPGISVGGHLGGLIIGSLVTAMMVNLDRARVPQWLGTGVALLAAAGLFLGSLWAAGTWVDPLF